MRRDVINVRARHRSTFTCARAVRVESTTDAIAAERMSVHPPLAVLNPLVRVPARAEGAALLIEFFLKNTRMFLASTLEHKLRASRVTTRAERSRGHYDGTPFAAVCGALPSGTCVSSLDG